MRTYLVTGGAGFIGSNYIHYMFRKYDNEIRIINVDLCRKLGKFKRHREQRQLYICKSRYYRQRSNPQSVCRK